MALSVRAARVARVKASGQTERSTTLSLLPSPLVLCPLHRRRSLGDPILIIVGVIGRSRGDNGARSRAPALIPRERSPRSRAHDRFPIINTSTRLAPGGLALEIVHGTV